MVIKNYENVQDDYALTVLIKGPRHGEFLQANIVKTAGVEGFNLLLPLEVDSYQEVKEDYLLGYNFSYETLFVNTLEEALDILNADYDTSLNMHTGVLTCLTFPEALSKIINESSRRFVFLRKLVMFQPR